MSAGVHPDSPLFAEVNWLYEIGMRGCRGNPLETAVMDFAAKVYMHVLMFATINYLLHFLIPICVDFWFGTTWVEILVGPVTECLCCLIIALSFLVYYVKMDENENWKTTSVQVLTQVLKQFLVLLDHFCIVSFLQLKKLRQILQEVENCIERDETLRVIFISELHPQRNG
ncbi:unnamed protein product [Orchesella dallaii]|uniref:Uncharacterized protein n=1 Tax=Orchesella dallaii TaxID=48710 RepID=A0ABP1PL10_9HEXA